MPDLPSFMVNYFQFQNNSSEENVEMSRSEESLRWLVKDLTWVKSHLS